jgi:amidase
MAGPDARDPACYPSDPVSFTGPLEHDLRGVRVAWSPALGSLPLDRRVRAVLESRRKTFEELGCVVEDAVPDLSGADDAFLTTRAWRVWSMLGPFLSTHRDEMKPEAIGEIERGAKLTGGDVARALVLHGEIMERMRRFQERYEFLVCAVNQVPPFDATIDWPKEIEGVAMDGYIAWMRSAYWITTTLFVCIGSSRSLRVCVLFKCTLTDHAIAAPRPARHRWPWPVSCSSAQ